MQACPNCKHLNRIGVVFCENCGASLIGDAPLGTRSIGINTPMEVREALAVIKSAEPFPADVMLRIEIADAEPILLKQKRETIFGRRDPATGAMPDVDMTPFAGYRMGVSRRHAAIRQAENNQLELWDLGSSNGTYLNGVRLAAHRPNRLQDGDEIRLGQMVLHVRFSHTAHSLPQDDNDDEKRSRP
ncbi:MAG: FHA domain-containing protein [Chloroflexi bacterium CFX4]|jgi:hypothetical protein|nr:FHA domain-containing protein [Chloroflexi bacterium CFX4]MDL1924158.1 FHA domain-containing protein [Chloroflexi bacterium CFX3]